MNQHPFNAAIVATVAAGAIAGPIVTEAKGSCEQSEPVVCSLKAPREEDAREELDTASEQAPVVEEQAPPGTVLKIPPGQIAMTTPSPAIYQIPTVWISGPTLPLLEHKP